MSVRNWLERNPAAAAGLVILALGAAAGIFFVSQRPETSKGIYYYDLTAKELVPGPPDEVPPIKTQKGNDAPRAFVFACGSCGDEKKRFIGYLESYTTEGKAALTKFKQIESGLDKVEEGYTLMDYDAAAREGRQVASGEAMDQWVVADSGEGRALVNAARGKCPQGELRECQP